MIILADESGTARITARGILVLLLVMCFPFLTMSNREEVKAAAVNDRNQSVDEISKELSNPVSSLYIFPFEYDFDGDDSNTDFFEGTGKKLDIDLADMDYISWRYKLAEDSEILELLMMLIEDITPSHDTARRIGIASFFHELGHMLIDIYDLPTI